MWIAGLASSLARWIDVLVFAVVAYQQTGSALWVANLMLLRMLPLGVFGVALGVLATRMSRRSWLLWTQGALMACALVLLALQEAGALAVWHLGVAALLSGITWAGDMPMRRGFIGDVVGTARMGHAMALDAVANNASRLVGPVLGGLLLASGGLSLALAVDVLLYVVVLATLFGLPQPPRHPAPQAAVLSVWQTMRSGLRIARESPPLQAVLCNTVVFNIFCWPTISMIPVVAQDRLGLDTAGVGLLASMDGLGSLIGAVLLIYLARRVRDGWVFIGGTFVFLLSLPLFALSTHQALAAVALLGMGIGQGMFAVMQSTLVFRSVAPDRRLVAMGLLTTFIGVSPLGFFMVGWLAQQLGASVAALVCAGGGLVAMLLTRRLWRPCVHADTPVPA